MNKRLIDGDKLLHDLNNDVDMCTWEDVIEAIGGGRYDLPSDQGEAARLREALINIRQHLNAGISEFEAEEARYIVDEALSSHTEDAEYVGPSKSSMGLMLNADGGKADE